MHLPNERLGCAGGVCVGGRARRREEGSWALGDAGSRVQRRDSAVSTGAAVPGWQMCLIPLPSAGRSLGNPPSEVLGRREGLAASRQDTAVWDGQGDNVVIESPSVGAAAPRPWRRMSGQSCLGSAGSRLCTGTDRGKPWLGGLRAADWGLRCHACPLAVGSPLCRGAGLPKALCVTGDVSPWLPGASERAGRDLRALSVPAPVSAPQAGKTPSPVGEATPRTWAGVTAQGAFVLDLVHLAAQGLGSAGVLEVTPLYRSSVAAIKPREWL